MKRLAHPALSSVLEFHENTVNTLVIENRPLFRRLVTDLYSQTEGSDGDAVLSEDFAPIPMDKHLELITQFVPFDINQKGLLTRLNNVVEKQALRDENYLKTQTLLADIDRFIQELLFDFPYDFSCSKLTVQNLIKAVGLVLDATYDREIEKVLDYLQLVCELEGDRVFVLVNMRSFFPDEEMVQFVTDAMARKLNLLLIDNTVYPKLPGEHRLIIDEDLCEI